MLSSTKISLRVFGVYVVLAGIITAFAPEVLYTVMFLDYEPNNTLNIAALLAMVIGMYYLNGSRGDCRNFAEGSVYVRAIFLGLGTLFILLDKVEWNWMIIFSIDLLGLIWTATALRHEKRTLKER